MSEKTWNPTEEQISKTMEGRTMRQLAIAYLRANRRANQSETAFQVMNGLADASLGLAAGKPKDVIDGLNKAKKTLRTSSQAGENS